MNAAQYLAEADKYPYELTPGDNPTPPDWAHRASRGCLTELCDRKGLGNILDEIDYDTRKDIIAALADIIREARKDSKQHVYILKDDYSPDTGSRIYGVYSTSDKASKALSVYESEENEYEQSCDSLDYVRYTVQ
jgi:hypothetical protein